MVVQYPITAIFFTGAQAGTKNADGTWTKPADLPPLHQACRYEPSTLNRDIAATDGVQVKYKGIIYIPLSASDVDPGSLVTITDLFEKQKILFFSRGQLNCRVYV